MNVLITAFGPFQEFSENPSEMVMKAMMADETIQNIPDLLIGWETITVSYSAVDQCQSRWNNQHYSLIIHMGVASQDSMMRLEVKAQNCKAGKDVEGVEPHSVPIVPDSEDAETRINMAILQQLCERYPGKVRISEDAGTYLCNYIYYQSLSRVKPDTHVLFVHIADFIQNRDAVSAEEQTTMLTDLLTVLKNFHTHNEKFSA